MSIRSVSVLSIVAAIAILSVSPVRAQGDPDPDDARIVQRFFETALVEAESYHLLDTLCNDIGPRLSGSQGAARAIVWTKSVMERYGFDRVYLQDVMVPHWERGDRQTARIEPSASGDRDDLSLLAIGGSVATPEGGITAPVLEVQSLDEVVELGEDAVRGKIVFYNRAFDHRNITTGAGYGGAVDQRTRGASRAAQYGAVAVVIRSVTSSFDDHPHTGTLIYADTLPRIPAGALGMDSADRLAARLKADPDTRLHLNMNNVWHPDAPSHNVVGELIGSDFPDTYITVGGHIDSWDVGHGAHDDGAGCMHSIGAVRLFQKLGIRPRHTLRAVMFINEENGTRGGKRYAEIAVEEGEKHLFAIESDAGGFTPRGIGVNAADSTIEKMRSWLPLFNPNTIGYIRKGGGGVDIRPLHNATGTPMAGLITDSQRMFDVHHSPKDVFESVNRREMELGTASLGAFLYLVDRYGL